MLAVWVVTRSLTRSYAYTHTHTHTAFKYPKFVAGLKRQFMQLFDADGNGELDRSELTTFIAAHVKQAFKAGLMPTAEFFDDGSLEQDQIETLLESRCVAAGGRRPGLVAYTLTPVTHVARRCKDMLKGYFALDKDHDGTYSWEELLPIVQDFYTNLWTAGRPKVQGQRGRMSASYRLCTPHLHKCTTGCVIRTLRMSTTLTTALTAAAVQLGQERVPRWTMGQAQWTMVQALPTTHRPLSTTAPAPSTCRALLILAPVLLKPLQTCLIPGAPWMTLLPGQCTSTTPTRVRRPGIAR